MPRNNDSTAQDILAAENAAGQGRYLPDTLSRIGKPEFKTAVVDSPEIFQLAETGSAGAVLIISNNAFPDFAADGANRAQAAAALLPAPLARHVLVARTTGLQDGRSYALYPRIQPLTSNKLLQTAQLALIKTPVLNWLNALAAQTRTPAHDGPQLETGFLAPYHYLLSEAGIPDQIKRHAQQALSKIEDASFQPVTVLQHGDFWRGNLLLGAGWPRTAEGLRHFAVIDWGSSVLTGYPFTDLLRFTRSLAAKDTQILGHLTAYADAAGVPADHLLHYVCAAAGHLGLNRNAFPLDRYLHAIEQLFDRAERLTRMRQ